MTTVILWMLLLLLFSVGAYGIWESLTAGEFTAREVRTGRAKYRYSPKWYHRFFHLAVSTIFLVTAVVAIVHRLRLH